MKKKRRYSKRNVRYNKELNRVQVAIGLGLALVVYRDLERLLDGNYPQLSSLVMGLCVGGVILFIPKLIQQLKTQKYRKDYENSTLYQIDKMDGIGFERYLKWLFEKRGYTAKTTSTTGDFGADLLLEKNGQNIVVQAKRYGSNVGIQAIQEVFTAQHYFDCDEAWVVTNSRFTKSAQMVAGKVNVRLIGRDELESFLNRKNENETVETYRKETTNIKRDCPKCKEKLILRDSKHGSFYGCSRFPECKYTEKV